MNFWKLFWVKFVGIFDKTGDVFFLFPKRSKRLAEHVRFGIRRLKTPIAVKDFRTWLTDFSILFFDLLGGPEIVEIFHDFVKFSSRPLNEKETEILTFIFGNSLKTNRIRVDERSFFGCKKRKICYVGFSIINSWGQVRDDVFAHELVHIWQFQQFGSVYIPRALRAQYSRRGYHYGGLEMLRKLKAGRRNLKALNWEQQADVVQDYFLLVKNRVQPKIIPKDDALVVFEYFIACLKEKG